MADVNRRVILVSRPQGKATESDFRVVETAIPRPQDGEFLVRIHYMSVDPYMRGLMADHGSYAEPVPVGGVMIGGTVGKVVESRNDDYAAGDVVFGHWGWQEYAVSNGEEAEKFDTSLGPMSTALGVLGMPGMTAYFGLLEVGQLQDGESVFVSGGAGAVGSLVGQIARIRGCHVAGSAGSPEKIAWMLEELGYDAAFNYKETHDYKSRLHEVCPDGIDVYFDNVGGSITDTAFTQINLGARIVLCGQISQYNETRVPRGPRVLWNLIIQQARAEGFIVHRFRDRFPEARRQVAQWLKEGKVTYRETISQGIGNAPAAFIGLFEGANIGKQLVRLVEE